MVNVLTPVKKGQWAILWRGPNHDWQHELFDTKADAIDYYNDCVSQERSENYLLAQVTDVWIGGKGEGLMGSGEAG